LALPQYCGTELPTQTKAGERIFLDGERSVLAPCRVHTPESQVKNRRNFPKSPVQLAKLIERFTQFSLWHFSGG
jgi:hypothetical protein